MALINFSGLASGIDSTSLIQAILDQQRAARVRPLQDKVSRLTDSNSAFDELKTKLEDLKSKLQGFRTINGGIVAKQAASTDETVATVSASNSASNTTFSITVAQLARNATYSFNSTFASTSTAIAPTITDTGNSSIAITVGTGSEQEAFNLSVTSTTTLDELATQFNASSEKAVASVINKGTSASPSYALVFSSLYEGSEQGTISATVGTDITTAGIFSAATVSQAQDAQFTVSGVSGTITRSSNSISDVFNGLTFQLEKTGTTTIAVSDDADATATSMQEFVDTYNDIVEYIKENNIITREEDGEEVTNTFAALADVSLDDQILTALRSAISSTGNDSGNVRIFADLGITTNRDGTLALNIDTLKEAISNDPNGVGTLTASLGETLGALGGTIAQYTQFNGILDSTLNSNKSAITKIQDQIINIERGLAKQEQTLTNQFARLESIVGRMQSQQQALTSILP